MTQSFPSAQIAPRTRDAAIPTGRSNWMLYGAYGVTGRRILAEALNRGHRPILAGRDGAQLAEMGRATGLTTIAVSLDDHAALRAALSGVTLVLHAAGPFRLTGPVMRAACLEAGCSYLDLNGEIGDLGAALDGDAKAKAAGIAIIPGVGYGVVFAEALAAHLAKRLPDASRLRLSLATQVDGRSRGANLSMAEIITEGGRDIFQGQLRPRPFASVNWSLPGDGGKRINFASAPLGELLAAHKSTRIPNIVAGVPLPRAAGIALQIAGPAIGRLLAWQARRSSNSASPRQSSRAAAPLRSRAWAEAENPGGDRVAAFLETGEGYQSAAAAAVRAVELQIAEPRNGALTPVQAFGTALALSVPDTSITDIPA